MRDPAWLLLFDIVVGAFVVFAFRHLWRAMRREQHRRLAERERLERIERKLDELRSRQSGESPSAAIL
jgi:hypothetical protein